ncbi:class I SAM-dependent methyltransferase [Pseudophaeobacter sp.]|jgi:demethylmenaquinone methyltransferase/2-methoxy-6-polyprenyl-1,4-benzoquinol methylase|uniref:class I SAM-dependent methyltransferase n=1 Tax=Pseudophaeobacter sp. TaxID=1971739 RepID=UPI003264A467
MSDGNKPIVVGEYYESHAEKQAFLRQVFDDTAKNYEAIAKWGWFGSGDWYRREALRRNGVTSEMRVLDVATGTGQVARALMTILDDPKQIECVEPSAGMIAEAKKRVPVTFHQSTAEKLPVENQSFDFLTMGFALRHVDSLDDSFTEYHRVLKDGGKVLIMDVTVPEKAIPKALFRLYFKHILPTVAMVLTRDRNVFRLMRYYWESMDQMVPIENVLDSLRKAGFTTVEHNSLLGCFSEYVARR